MESEDGSLAVPQLDQLMGAYYHEDFDIYGELWGALDQYLVDTPRDEVEALERELDVALGVSDEAAVEALLSELNCAVYMGDDPDGYRGWLEEIDRRVAEALGQTTDG